MGREKNRYQKGRPRRVKKTEEFFEFILSVFSIKNTFLPHFFYLKRIK